MKTKTIVNTDYAPKAIGPYSQGICVNGLFVTSGQLPVNPGTGKIESNDIREQTRQSLENIRAILKEGQLSFDNVIKTTVFLADINDFAEMNQVYAEYFPENCPARSCFQVAALPMGAKVEIEVMCSRGYLVYENH
ncbi:RidA family protein [Bariatricus sp. SGI.154]|uniref:RidA family protein n=1 Tax=Bariatricus sp. SGI.154 TaxID=3420549 RepID=UPI003D025D96